MRWVRRAIIGALLVSGALAVAVLGLRDGETDAGATDAVRSVPSNLDGDGLGIVAPSRSDAEPQLPRVVVYYDLNCLACRFFFDDVANYLDDVAASGSAVVIHRPVAFLAATRADRYSARALNAAACVLDRAGAGPYVQFVRALFDRLPAEEESARLTDGDLADLASETSDGEASRACVEDSQFSPWVDDVTRSFISEAPQGINQVPTVFVDDQIVDGGIVDGQPQRASVDDIATTLSAVSP